jgi:hypothetical protein
MDSAPDMNAICVTGDWLLTYAASNANKRDRSPHAQAFTRRDRVWRHRVYWKLNHNVLLHKQALLFDVGLKYRHSLCLESAVRRRAARAV